MSDLMGVATFLFAIFFIHRWLSTWQFCLLLISLCFYGLGFYFLLWMEVGPLKYWDVVRFTLYYGAGLFLLLSEIAIRGGARRLNRISSNWIKRIDYVYLSLGALGAVFAISRIGQVEEAFKGGEIFSPLLIMTALALRAVKTRAEINGWDKL